MRNRNFLVIFVGMVLTLFFASHGLAQAPILGWGKARFGMSPEEVSNIYREEEENYNNIYQKKMDYIEKYYANDPEELQQRKEWMKKNEKEFWFELDEDTSIPIPHRLVTLHLQPIPPFEGGETWPMTTFKFGDNGLFEIEARVGVREVSDIYGKELFGENKSDNLMEKAEKASNEFDRKLGTLFYMLSDYGESEEIKEEGTFIWVWKDSDDNMINLEVSGFRSSHNNREYILSSGLTMTCSGVRAAVTYAALRKYVGKPRKPEDLFREAWEKFTTEVWGTPHPTTAREAAEAVVKGEPVPPVPHKYNAWVERMEIIDYSQVPDFDKPLAAFLTIGGRTLRSFGSPTDVERIMDMPAIRANKRLETVLGLTEDLESWNAASFKNRSFLAKFAAYLELTKSVVTSDKLKDFLFKDWLYGNLEQPETEPNMVTK